MLNEMEAKVLAVLRSKGESSVIYPDGRRFLSVYLDNAKFALKMSGRQFAGYLSALEEKGFYKVSDGKFFGDVLDSEEA